MPPSEHLPLLRVPAYLHDEVGSECADTSNTNAGLGRAVCGSYACPVLSNLRTLNQVFPALMTYIQRSSARRGVSKFCWRSEGCLIDADILRMRYQPGDAR